MTRYRDDIDGLRLIAVLAVIFYHFLGDAVPAGYLGVDVFFAISGFVITQKLMAEHSATGKIAVSSFFLGRMKRLLPALLLMIFPTMFALSFLAGDFGEQDYVEVINNAGMMAFFGLSNFVLYSGTSDYFSQNAELNPFTHTWSLAVEEQFYLVFPLLLLLGQKWANKDNGFATQMMRLLGGIVLASFCGALLLRNVDASLVFYLLPFRLWELGAGCLLAFYLANPKRAANSVPYAGVIAGVCLAGLGCSLFIAGASPLMLQLVAVVTTIGLIYAGAQGNWVARLLAVRPVVYGGKLSYSLYLWHWPLLVLAKWSVGMTTASLLLITALTVVFAALSYHFVETPLRRRVLTGSTLRGIVKMQAAAITVLLVMIFGNQFVTEDLEFHAPALMGITPAESWGRGLACHDSQVTKTMADPLRSCVKPGRTKDKPHALFLVGESHAAQLIFGVDQALKDTRYERRYFWHGDLTATFPYTFFDAPPGPTTTLDAASAWSIPGDIVVFTYHRGWVHDKRDNHVLGHNDVLSKRSTAMLANLTEVIEQLAARGVNVVLSLDGPLVARRVSVQSCAIQQKWSGRSVCAIDRKQDERTRRQQEIVFAELVGRFDNVVIYDPFVEIYKDRKFIDVLDADGGWVMYDYNHISRAQSVRLAASFRLLLDDSDFLR
ncbi:MAG: acyltransferase family protein [Alphaproteobacteria bacterium]